MDKIKITPTSKRYKFSKAAINRIIVKSVEDENLKKEIVILAKR